MKRNAIIRIVLWSLTLAVLLVLLVAGMSHPLLNFSARRSMPSQAAPVPGDAAVYALPANDIQNVEIDWISGDISVQSADLDHIQVSESPVQESPYAMVCQRDDHTLKIAFCEGTLSSIKNFGTKSLTVLVPRDWVCQSLEISAASAKFTGRALTIREVSLDTASGASRFEDCTVGKLDVNTASADVFVSGTLQELECDSASANVTAELENTPDKIEMDTASGSILLKLPADAGFTVSMDALRSKFDSDFPTTRQDNRYLCGSGSCKINMDSMSGKISIYRK